MEFFSDRRVQFPLALLLGAGIAVAGVALCGGFDYCNPNPDVSTTTTFISTTTTTTTTITPPTDNSTNTTATTPTPTTIITPSPEPKSPYFNVFTLRSLQTYCKSNRDGTCYLRHPIPQANLSIEVLATSLIDKQIILDECPSNETFDINQFDQVVIDIMNERWAAPYSDDKGNNVKFWSQKWDNYGTCTGKRIVDYFISSISFSALISNGLNESSIYPSNNRPYFFQNFTNALFKINDFKENQFFLMCQTEGDQQWLDQINLCLSYENLYQPVDCDFRILGSNCDETLPIYFVQNYTAPVGGGNNLLGNY